MLTRSALAMVGIASAIVACTPESAKPATMPTSGPAGNNPEMQGPAGAPTGQAPATPACAPGPVSCGADKKSLVATSCGATNVMQSCLGPGGCTQSGAGVRCDESIARAGEACRLEQSFGCSPEKDAMTQCRSGKVVLVSTCKGVRKCSTAGAVQCDTSIADQGDACATEGRMACARDAKTLLRCQSGTFNTGEQCKYQPCLIGSGKVLCR